MFLEKDQFRLVKSRKSTTKPYGNVCHLSQVNFKKSCCLLTKLNKTMFDHFVTSVIGWQDRHNAQSSCAGLFVAAHLGFDFPGVWIHVDMASPVHAVSTCHQGYLDSQLCDFVLICAVGEFTSITFLNIKQVWEIFFSVHIRAMSRLAAEWLRSRTHNSDVVGLRLGAAEIF
jgi:hypothetical protein